MQTEILGNAPTQTNAARGDFVARRGTFFQIGDYPDKQFGLTEQEADEAIARFVPVPLNVEHIPTIFDGKLGMVRRLWREGRDILAEYAIPRWLHEVTRGEAIKISSEWNRASKLPIGGAFVLQPRVAHAVMQAAFKAEEKEKRRRGEKETEDRRDVLEAPAVLCTSRCAEALSGSSPACCCARNGEAGRLRGVAFALKMETWEAGGTRKRAGKGEEAMSLLAGLRALFQRVGVSCEEIDAHLHAPLSLEGDGIIPHEGTKVSEAGNSAFGGTSRAAEMREAAEPGRSADGDEARFAAMEAELARWRRQAEEAEFSARFAVDSRLIDGWVRGFQMTPGEAEAWRAIAHDKPAAFAAVLPALQARPRLPQLAGVTIKASETADVDRLEVLTQQKMKASGLDHTAAFKEVCGENRELALSVRARSQEGN